MDASSVVLLLLLSVAGSSAKNGALRAAVSQPATLQPWLVGLTAVVGFLFIVFTILVVRRFLRKNRDGGDGGDYHEAVELEDGICTQTRM